MLSITRRTFARGVGVCAMTPGLGVTGVLANGAKQIFMMDAISHIREGVGLPKDPRTQPGWNPEKQARPVDRDGDVRRRPPRHKDPQRWGGVCIPVPFADFDFYYTDGAAVWEPNPGQKLPSVTVPHGFCCDLTSIPQFFWTMGLPKTGRYAYAAIVHDFLYWDQKIATRDEADEILYVAMLDSGVGWITRQAIDVGVSKAPYFSQRAWDNNTRAKHSGELRFLKKFPPRDQIVSWATWSKDKSNFIS